MNLWGFRNKNPGMMIVLQQELDFEVWEDVAARLGLTYLEIEVRMYKFMICLNVS